MEEETTLCCSSTHKNQSLTYTKPLSIFMSRNTDSLLGSKSKVKVCIKVRKVICKLRPKPLIKKKYPHKMMSKRFPRTPEHSRHADNDLALSPLSEPHDFQPSTTNDFSFPSFESLIGNINGGLSDNEGHTLALKASQDFLNFTLSKKLSSISKSIQDAEDLTAHLKELNL